MFWPILGAAGGVRQINRGSAPAVKWKPSQLSNILASQAAANRDNSPPKPKLDQVRINGLPVFQVPNIHLS